ncbi:hypothetical protein D4764_0156980 [Takifugu flavidus]|uniref:Uncharacterized protein n=1 Tax=Takifugu flavidus TaxID=433684 RepID=A0A5C6MHW2_9TELE|nr:hypothetical protein D4764_0156980 [Takifugu flavidus]
MGCCCSKTEEWRDSDSNSDSDSDSISGIDSDISSLSDILHYSGWSTKTVEHRQHTTAGTQHAWLDAELKGDSRCKEEPEVLRNPTRGVGPTLDSDPCVALPRLSTGGEENTPVVSKPSKPVQSTLVGPLSVAFMVTQASGDHQRPKVDPKPQRDEKGGEELHVLTTAPPQAFKTTTCSIGCMCDIDADDLEQEQSQCATAGATDESINRAANQTLVHPEHLLLDQTLVHYKHLLLDQTLVHPEHLLLDQTLVHPKHLLLDQTLVHSKHLLLDQTLVYSTHLLMDQTLHQTSPSISTSHHRHCALTISEKMHSLLRPLGWNTERFSINPLTVPSGHYRRETAKDVFLSYSN